MLQRTKRQSGFTIVELLIVIVVIGILAAIVIVAYNGLQTRANNTIVESNLNNTATALGVFHAYNGNYPSTGPDASSIKSSGLKLKNTLSNVLLYCVDTAMPNAWVVLAFGYPAGTTYRWTSAGERNSNSGVIIGSGTTTCQAQMGGIASVAGYWGFSIATVQ